MPEARQFTAEDVCLGRVVSEDDAYVILEVAKSDQRELEVRQGDRFFTVIFTDGKPWGYAD